MHLVMQELWLLVSVVTLNVYLILKVINVDIYYTYFVICISCLTLECTQLQVLELILFIQSDCKRQLIFHAIKKYK